MLSNPFLILFLAGALLQFILDEILEGADFRHRKIHGREIPVELADFFDDEKISMTIAYENAKYFAWIPRDAVSLALNLTLVISGFYGLVFERIFSATQNPYFVTFAFFFLITIPEKLVSIPFDIYSEFSIEKKFGFSTMTAARWISDGAKSFVLGLLVSALIYFPAVFAINRVGGLWWLFLGAIVIAISVFVAFIYPVFIAPIFNKFSPLPEGELKSRLEKLFASAGMSATGIFVMDESRRSKHSNAYFVGFGKNKRIVLYDTLIDQMDVSEIESVLAHEIGHCKKKHILKRMAVTLPLLLCAIFVASRFVESPLLYMAFGIRFDAQLPFMRLIGIGIVFCIAAGFSALASLAGNFFSRRAEFEADKFASEICGSPKPLVSALIKLAKENLTELTVPKIYSVFNYSHPPLAERIAALNQR